LPAETPPADAAAEFTTDFRKHIVPYAQIQSGGPPKDGIPAIDHPAFITVRAATSWLAPTEPVVALQIGRDARAYPVRVLVWHEIVNDTVGGVPVAVTYCPLCNAAIAFERRVQGRVLDFGTTGRLHYSNLVMYDRQTESWWQQATGQAIAGAYTGTQLTYRSAPLLSWSTFASAYPQGRVLSQATGYQRAYGENPYVGYDDPHSAPFLYTGPQTPGALPPMARVLTLDLQGDAVAYPYTTLQRIHVVDDTVGGSAVAVFWMPGTASPLDAPSVAGGRDVGAAFAYRREVRGRRLTFMFTDGRIVDRETHSTWTALGQAVRGQLAGASLQPVVAINHFWFDWAAFRPHTRIYHG
jgi:hypothetical protein